MTRRAWMLLLTASSLSGFDRARPGYEYVFPRDHFSHPNFQTEWWYYSGNLKTARGRGFGFQLTFFRFGVETPAEPESAWGAGQIYLAHLTLSDIEAGEFFKTERLNRAGPGLAGADLSQARVWNGNWEVEWLEPADPLGTQRLRAVSGEFSLEFELTPLKAAVIHGQNGVSQKAAGEGKASHYVSFTRLAAEGAITRRGQTFQVAGLAWMDHEFSTDSMAEDQIGWDWMSIQLSNNTELMLYRMRRSGGLADPHSSGTFVDQQGRALHLPWRDIEMQPSQAWTSPRTGARYPLEWKISIPRLRLSLESSTPLPHQEVVSERSKGVNYWEGAADFSGTMGGEPVHGMGYIEMTGYDKPLRMTFQPR